MKSPVGVRVLGISDRNIVFANMEVTFEIKGSDEVTKADRGGVKWVRKTTRRAHSEKREKGRKKNT